MSKLEYHRKMARMYQSFFLESEYLGHYQSYRSHYLSFLKELELVNIQVIC